MGGALFAGPLAIMGTLSPARGAKRAHHDVGPSRGSCATQASQQCRVWLTFSTIRLFGVSTFSKEEIVFQGPPFGVPHVGGWEGDI